MYNPRNGSDFLAGFLGGRREEENQRIAASKEQYCYNVEFRRYSEQVAMTVPNDRAVRGRFILPLYVALTALLCLPFFWLTFPPFVDYPNHLARSYVLMHYTEAPLFQAAYRRDYAPIYNLAIDLVVPPLARLTGLAVAGRTFLILLIATYAAGCYLLASVIHGGRTWLAFVPLMFAYNSPLIMGFVNYYFGVALYLVVFACWLRWKRAWSTLRVLAFAGLAAACYLSHLTSVGLLGVSVACVSAYEYFTERPPLRGMWITGFSFLPVVALYLIYVRRSAQTGTSIQWNTVKGKLIALLAVIRTYDVGTDVVLLVCVAACLAFLILKSSKVSVSVPILICGVVLMLTFAVAPEGFVTSSAFDSRFVWPGYVLIALAFRPRIRPGYGAICFVCFMLIFLVRAGILWSYWRDLDVKISRIVRVFDQLPREQKVFPAYFESPGVKATKLDQAVKYVLCYAVISHNTYVPTMFAIKGQQPIVSREMIRFHSWKPGAGSLWAGYDYVWTYKPPAQLVDALSRTATPIASAEESTLWSLNSVRSHAVQ